MTRKEILKLIFTIIICYVLAFIFFDFSKGAYISSYLDIEPIFKENMFFKIKEYECFTKTKDNQTILYISVKKEISERLSDIHLANNLGMENLFTITEKHPNDIKKNTWGNDGSYVFYQIAVDKNYAKKQAKAFINLIEKILSN